MPRAICLTALLLTVPALAAATPFDLFVASVTCLPNTQSAESCWSDPVATTAHWRVINWMGSPAAGGWFNEDTSLQDVDLTFAYAGGSRTWHWDSVEPLRAFAETEELPITTFRSFERLTLSATVGRTEFGNWGGSPYQLLLLNDPRVSATATSFPPPLDLFAPAEEVSLPTPEPASLALVASGLAGCVVRRAARRSRRSRAGRV